MAMRRSWILAVAMASGTMVFEAPASACAINPVICFSGGSGCNPSPAERRARQQRWSAEVTMMRSRSAQERLRSGEVDVAAELSEMMVPNVRPVWIEMTECGPRNEVDLAGGSESEEVLFRRLIAGSPLEGDPINPYWRFLNENEVGFGARCNREFRQDFAAHLNRSVSSEQLREAWLFLVARHTGDSSGGAALRRMVTFRYRTRVPPVYWDLADEWLHDQVERYVRRQPAGRALAAAANSFWVERASDLQDDARVCPLFNQQWQGVRERTVAQMVEHRVTRLNWPLRPSPSRH